MGRIIKFAVVTGLRPAEVVESVRLLINGENKMYYNEERQALEHFRFPEIFIRQTKKAYISFITSDMLESVMPSDISDDILTYNAIRLACRRKDINMDMRLCRKIHGSWLHQHGITTEEVDFLQGRTSTSVFGRHYLTPDNSLRTRVLDALKSLQQSIKE